MLTAFKQFLASRGLRVTRQRVAIFEAAVEAKEHFTAEDLLRAARERDKTVSRASVYRTIPLMVESGVLREIDVGKDHKYYTAQGKTETFQTQVICVDCDRIYEVDAPFMEWYGKTVSEKLGMEPVSQRLQITSKCLKHQGHHCSNRKCGNDG